MHSNTVWKHTIIELLTNYDTKNGKKKLALCGIFLNILIEANCDELK